MVAMIPEDQTGSQCWSSNQIVIERQCNTIRHWPITFQRPMSTRVQRQAMAVLMGTALGVMGLTTLLGLKTIHDVRSDLDRYVQQLGLLRRAVQVNLRRQARINEGVRRMADCHDVRLALLDAGQLISTASAGLEALVGQHRATATPC